MARTAHVMAEPPDVTAINLKRALSRLEQRILISPNPRLASSSFERTKVSANVEYARTLLLRLEHEASNLKIQSRKQDRQKTLFTQRALIRRLTERLHELDSQDPNVYTSESEGEDLLGENVQAQARPGDPTSTASTNPSPEYQKSWKPLEPSFRNRLHPSNLPTPSPGTSSALPPNPTAQQLESHSTEQVDLTSSMVALVAQLKASTLAFSSSLDLDKEALARAQEGLEKNETGMEAAGKRMGMLKRMSEGKGWWGRIMLYAWIGGLWLIAIALVFVGPKFRF
ncbi:MAG: hypothetical protein L6R40_005828 [Gallowayella cf. fulva]|nr:MAG: hypothetical protein L6R40_005828 [Xanthomendoza cf. fulva]